MPIQNRLLSSIRCTSSHGFVAFLLIVCLGVVAGCTPSDGDQSTDNGDADASSMEDTDSSEPDVDSGDTRNADTGSADDADTCDECADAHDGGSSDDWKPLPSRVDEDLEGDFELTSGQTAIVDPDSDGIWIGGDLVVRTGATLELQGGFSAHDVTFEEGSVFRTNASDGSTTGFYADDLIIDGTPSSPIQFGGDHSSITVDRLEAQYAYFEYIFFQVENPNSDAVVVTDSIFENPSPNGSLYAVGNGSETTRVEHNTFVNGRLGIANATVRKNRFRNTNLWIAPEAVPNWAIVSCEGDRSDDPDVDVQQNAFSDLSTDDEVIAISRYYGELDLSGNYFEGGLPSRDGWIEQWDGGTAGCGDDLGSFGGPATFEPTLDSPPDDGGPRSDVRP